LIVVVHHQNVFFSYINSKKKTQPLTCLKTQHGIIADDKLIANELCSFFKSVFNTPLTKKNNIRQSFNDNTFNPFFSVQDVYKILSELNPNSSPGPDGIHPMLLKNCANTLSIPLYLIFCISLRTGFFSSAWKDANVIPLHKGGSPSSSENYRPISLLSSVAKVFEKIVASYLTNYLLENNIIHSAQHGFIKGKSCLTNLLTAINDWTLAVDRRQSCDVIYLDFKKAFDMVDHSILYNKLQKLDLPPFLLVWLNSYLCNRRLRVSVRGSFSNWCDVPSGVPQGSVLGPTLFNIFINDLPLCLRHSMCLLFADDLKIYRTIQSHDDPLLLQSDLNSIFQWAKTNRMTFNVPKSAVLHIGFNNRHFQYTLDNVVVPAREHVRDLGVIVDNKLKFHQQCAAAAKKAISTASYIFKAFSYLNTTSFSKIYKVFIRPHLDYCIQAWRPHYKKSFDILEKTQRKITKWCPGLSSNPYESRLRTLSISTLEDRYNRGDLIETFKILNNHYTVSSNSFFERFDYQRTRGHNLKLCLPNFRCDIRKHFFSNRVVHLWNKLPEHIEFLLHPAVENTLWCTVPSVIVLYNTLFWYPVLLSCIYLL